MKPPPLARAFVLFLCGAMGAAALASAEVVAATPDLSGTWLLDESLFPLQRPQAPASQALPRGWKGLGGYAGGTVPKPPLQPDAIAAIRREQQLELAGRSSDERALACKPFGHVDLMTGAFKLDVFQAWNEVVILGDSARALPRHLYIDHVHPSPDDIDITVMGRSVAKWDGDTLVVDTVAIEPDVYLLSADYIPVSDNTHVVERLRLQDPVTLMDTMTITDPKVFTAPWTIRLVYHKQPAGGQVTEKFCNPNAKTHNG